MTTKMQRNTQDLFQKVNGAAGRLYAAIIFAEGESFDEKTIKNLKNILKDIEEIADSFYGKDRAENQRKHEYAQQRLSRNL